MVTNENGKKIKKENIMNKWLKLIDFFGLLDNLVDSISGELRTVIVEGLQEARKKARETDNKMDDIVMDFLCFIFNVPDEA